MEAYNRDEFQIWFIEFHARKESLGIAELTKYLDERLCKLNGQGISIADFFLGYHEYDSSGNKFTHLHCVLVTRRGRGYRKIACKQLDKLLNHIVDTKRFSMNVKYVIRPMIIPIRFHLVWFSKCHRVNNRITGPSRKKSIPS